MKNMKIDANGTEIRVMGDVVNEEAYISLTDIAKYKNPDNAFIMGRYNTRETIRESSPAPNLVFSKA